MEDDSDIHITNSARGPVGDGCRSDKPETKVQIFPCRPIYNGVAKSGKALGS